ncbi:cytochrome P450 [Elsinoe ampelina]|uniref:Cytochrome P450 n=1 Tax=Elsinoe ampelina TaxID=302913 RepID=A0A6A6GK30_9PEZI|nr:cytochrome P450 [Elsinoe ampelina]
MAYYLEQIAPSTYLGAAVVAVLLGLLYYATLPKPIPGIPYNKKHANRLFGVVPDLIRHVSKTNTLVDFLTAQGQELDTPIFQTFFGPFVKPAVMMTDYRENYDILTKRAPEFDRSKIFEDFFSGLAPDHHIHMPTNARWKAQRKLLADTMSATFLHNVAAVHLEKQISLLMDLWQVKSRTGHAFHAADDINHMALDSIWAVAFGTDIDTIKTQKDFLQDRKIELPSDKDDKVIFPAPDLPADYHAIITVTDSVTVAARSPFPKLAHWWVRQHKYYKTARARTTQLVTSALEDAKRRLLTKEADDSMINCATDNMVRREQQAAAKEGREPGFDSPAAKDELLGFLIAGHDTTSTTVMWGVKFLADNQQAQTKLRAALREAHPDIAKGQMPTADAISKAHVPYFDAVLEEMLRLSITVPTQSRKALKDVVILGHRIPAGTDVSQLANGPGYILPDPYADKIDENLRSPTSREAKGKVGTWGDDVREFVPERWLKTDGKGVTVCDPRAGPSLPFGAGPRGCFGRKLAYLELKVLFTLMLWRFELKTAPKALSGYAAEDTLTHKPKQCYILPVPIE